MKGKLNKMEWIGMKGHLPNMVRNVNVLQMLLANVFHHFVALLQHGDMQGRKSCWCQNKEVGMALFIMLIAYPDCPGPGQSPRPAMISVAACR
jgi:hypothetical protein